MTNKILKITIHDNDFSGPLERACKDMQHELADRCKHYIADILADPEGLRNALVIRTFGYVVVEDARIHMTRHYRLARHNAILKPEPAKRHIETRSRDLTVDYLDQNLQVEIIDTMQHEPEWSNGEVVYIDLDAKTVETR